MEDTRKREIKVMLQNMEAILQEKRKSVPFNPLPHYTLHKILSQLAPQFYNKQELAQIEKVGKRYLPMIEGGAVNNKKRGHSSDEGNMSQEERRVKPKHAEKKEPKKKDKENVSLPQPKLPTLVENKIKELNGHDIKYVMCKKIFLSDLDKHNNRLSMPTELDYLNEKEKLALNKRDQNGYLVGLEVVVLDPCFREFSMSLRKWDMKNSSVYNLVQDWKLVLSKNNFKKDQKLNIWSFRGINNKLHFVLDDNVNSEKK